MTPYNLADLIQLDRDSLSVFCGAGISRDSGLPLANELKRAILAALPIPETEHDLYVNAQLPFEAFMEVLADNCRIQDILDIFLDGQPNTNHRLIARLVAEGTVRFIYTTNFDLLLERALTEVGLQQGRDFQVISREKEFADIGFDEKTCYVLKLHGSADDPESIRTTLRGIAAKSLSEHRMRLIRHCFADGPHTSTLILGYSCSDLFDLVPQIQSIKQSTKKIILIEHGIGKEPTEWKILQMQQTTNIGSQHNPFSRFTGVIVQCDTGAFMKAIWQMASHLLGPYTASVSTLTWRDRITKWGTHIPRPMLCLVAGFLSLRVMYYEKAETLAQEALRLNEQSNVPRDSTFWVAVQLSAYRILEAVWEKRENAGKALQLAQESLKIAQASSNDEGGILDIQIDIARILTSCGDLSEAAQLYKDASTGYRKLQRTREANTCASNLGMLYARLGEPKAALAMLETALDDARNIGDLELVIDCYNNLGNIHYRLAKYWQDADAIQHAITCHEYALDLAQKLGSVDQEARCLNNLGLSRMLQREYLHAENYFKQALVIAQDIHHLDTEATCCNNIGQVFMDQKEYDKAVQWSERAIETSKRAKDKIGEAIGYTNIALCYMLMDDYGLALQYNETANQLARETSEWWPLYTILNTQADIYDHFGRHNEAAQAITELLELAQSLGDKFTEYDCRSRLGVCYQNGGDFREAINCYLPWIEETRQAYSSRRNVLLDTGFCYQRLKDYPNALAYYALAATAAEKIGDSRTIAKCSNNSGAICFERREFSLALEHYHRALEMAQALGDGSLESACYLNTALVEKQLGRHDDAWQHCSIALSKKEEIGDQQGVMRCLKLMSEICKETGDFERALQVFAEIGPAAFSLKMQSLRDALECAIGIGDHEQEITILQDIIRAWFDIGRPDQAVPAIEQLRTVAHNLGKRREESIALEQLAQAYRTTDLARAIVLYQERLQVDSELGDWEQEMHDLNNLGTAHGLLGKSDTALAFFEHSLAIAREKKQVQAEQQILANMSRLRSSSA